MAYIAAKSAPFSLPGPADLNARELAIWRTVAYGDIFDYPLTVTELCRYLEGCRATEAELRRLLLSSKPLQNYLSQADGFLFLRGRSQIVQWRHERQLRMAELLPVVRRYGRWLAGLPFVRLVALTGSLAMANPTERADIDFFVVTKAGRVWLTRALIIAIVRLAARRGHLLCPNFILSRDALHFKHQNLYVAREIAQMIPLCGADLYQELRSENPWTESYLPNASGAPTLDLTQDVRPAWWQRGLEQILSGRGGDSFERWEMRRKIRKFRAIGLGAETAFSADFCKGHFEGHEGQVLARFGAKLSGGTGDER